MTETPLLAPLQCPQCRGELEGGPGAMVTLCRRCRLAVHMKNMEKTYPLRYLKPILKESGKRVYAPFWLVEGALKLSTASERQSKAYRRAKALGALFFPAFWSPRLGYFDNLTLTYARLGEALAFEEGRSDRVADGVRSPEILAEMARLAWLGYLDRIVDVTGVEARYHIEAVAYAAVPFFIEGDKLVDGLSGARLPRSFVL